MGAFGKLLFFYFGSAQRCRAALGHKRCSGSGISPAAARSHMTNARFFCRRPLPSFERNSEPTQRQGGAAREGNYYPLDGIDSFVHRNQPFAPSLRLDRNIDFLRVAVDALLRGGGCAVRYQRVERRLKLLSTLDLGFDLPVPHCRKSFRYRLLSRSDRSDRKSRAAQGRDHFVRHPERCLDALVAGANASLEAFICDIDPNSSVDVPLIGDLHFAWRGQVNPPFR